MHLRCQSVRFVDAAQRGPRLLRLAAIASAACVGASCCTARHHVAPAPGQYLVVLPVFTDVPVSGFPVSERNVLAAAHAFREWNKVAAVQGEPMTALLPPSLESIQMERDWLQLCATRDRFQPNVIDPEVALSNGDPVIIGGFPAPKQPYDPFAHALAKPTIVEGHVLPEIPEMRDRSILRVEIPAGEYCGFSGGPAAIIDPRGIIRVWGIAVAGYNARDNWPPWRRFTVMYVVRLTKADVTRIQGMKKLNPLEAK